MPTVRGRVVRGAPMLVWLRLYAKTETQLSISCFCIDQREGADQLIATTLQLAISRTQEKKGNYRTDALIKGEQGGSVGS